jgi:ABC-type tungstate transport system permease subunit
MSRRGVTPLLIAALAAAIGLLAPALASADSSATLTVVGTSDVSDSGLMPNLIGPAFNKAYPQFTFKYIGTATGAAITNAETGANGPSVLIVHAASLENQFVGNRFSYEQYGRAIFTNDFVLSGPKSDPAGVSGNGAHNVAQALADVAAAGINNGGTPKATFVSRGGTPGTTVEEHKLWALVSSSGLTPAGLLLCTVNATNGGGETPIAAGNGVTSPGQPCPNGGASPTGSQLPSWYVVTGLTQGPNVVAANSCSAGNIKSGPNSCYVLTDRGTYDYLASGTDPAGSIPNLTIVTRDDSSTSPGGAYELVNYFHAYIINPTKPGETVNLTAAQDFLNFITAPALQSQLQNYLANTGDPGGPPFKADASPTIKTSKLPRTYHAGKRLKITGTLTNAEPGYPPLAGKRVAVDQQVAGVPIPLASAKTSSSGRFTIRFTPPVTGSYEFTTGQISQIEDANLSPPFGDLLSPAATTPAKVTVHNKVTELFARSLGAKALVYGSVAPGTGHVDASVNVLARPTGSKLHYTLVGTDRLGASDSNFALAVKLGAGRWQIEVKYQDPKHVIATTSRSITVTIGTKPAVNISLSSAKAKNGIVTASSLGPLNGGKVELLAFQTSGGAARVRRGATAEAKGRFTLGTRLKRGNRWVLLLEYVSSGRAPSYSGLTTVNVR